MAIRITAVCLEGGNAHEHIVRLWWTNPANSQTGDNSRAQLVSWIETQNGKAYVEDAHGDRADVGVVTGSPGFRRLRSRPRRRRRRSATAPSSVSAKRSGRAARYPQASAST